MKHSKQLQFLLCRHLGCHTDGLGVQVDEGGGFMGQDDMMKRGATGVDGGGVLLLL